MRSILSLSAVVVSATALACSSAAPALEGPAPFDPAGVYDFTADVGGGTTIPGVLTITRTSEYGYSIEGRVEGETHVAQGESIEVTGQHVVLHLIGGAGEPVVFHLDFNETGFTGAVATSEGSVPVTGTRRRPGGAAPFDPTGFYDMVALLGGDERTGTLEIERTATGLAAEAWITGESQPAIADSIEVDGSHVVLHTLVGGGDAVTFDLHFDDDAFTGVILVALDSIDVTGQRRQR